MKNNITILILIIAIGLVVLINYTHTNRLKRQLTIEAAKTSFVMQHCENAAALYDSVYAKEDTVSFYKNGSFLGKSVIVTE